ncbi:MAG TPA: flavodoxin family protein [Victivallales bacterium]|nr:flavodoxin family protein [Victivallales bacterium]
MKKLFAFIGSPKKSGKSNTSIICQELINIVHDRFKDIKTEIITAGDIKLEFCSGCGECIKTGRCGLDKKDNMPLLKQKISEADIIIWGSPVYTYSVSGQMKTFMDRLCSNYHSMPLIGKLGVSIATTGIDGLEQVHNLNEALLGALGIPVISKIGFTQNQIFEKYCTRKEILENSAQKIVNYIQNNKDFTSNDFIEEVYKIMKVRVSEIFKYIPDSKEPDIFKYDTFLDAYKESIKSIS